MTAVIKSGVILETALPGVEKEEAQKIVEEAHEFCPDPKRNALETLM